VPFMSTSPIKPMLMTMPVKAVCVVLLCALLTGHAVSQAGLVLAKPANANVKASTARTVGMVFLPPVATINPRWTSPATAQPPDKALSPSELSPVTLKGQVNTPTLTTQQPVTRLDKPIVGAPTGHDPLQVAATDALAQEELTSLWRATVDRNPVIRFALNKLTTPADLSPKYSSRFLNRTLNTLITGGAVAAMLVPGGGAYRNMGIMAGGDTVKNLLNGQTAPRVGALSPTEQIQLAGLVDELRSRLIQHYWEYRSAIIALDAAMAVTNQADIALRQATSPALKLSKQAHYDHCLLDETQWLEQAKQHYLQLTRLAGVEAVANLKWVAEDGPLAERPASNVPNNVLNASPGSVAPVMGQPSATDKVTLSNGVSP
jgi:hypothetical protein